ncbi:MAG: ribonuclease R [Hyphomicrobiaceae bacterium]
MTKKPARTHTGAVAMPSKEQVLDFIAKSGQKVGKREIARAFGLKGPNRITLKHMLAEMAEEGLIDGERKSIRRRGHLPPVAVVEIVAQDGEGDLIARPAVWERDDGEPPRILVLPGQGANAPSQFGVGDRLLARIEHLGRADLLGYRYEARPIKLLPRDRRRQLGIFRTRDGKGGVIAPINRKELREWRVLPGDEGGAADGDLVRYEMGRAPHGSLPVARIAESLGNPDDQRKVSLIAVHAHGLPDEFSARALAELDHLPPLVTSGRTDLRSLPLVTIDPVDARDHDDAVHAAADADTRNPGGFLVTVAIADVAHYVRFGTALDREAATRGNSIYFPDRVVPMLPERISNDLCSLREAEERPCLAVRIVFDANGAKRGQQFVRGIMRSAAKLTYQEAQDAIDGKPSDRAAPLLEPVLKPLWAAYRALARARDERQPLDLDLPERKILLDATGQVERVVVPPRLEAHRLIEEFMIQANVAAAEVLEKKHAPVVYRVHDAPSREKLAALRDFLQTLDLKLAASGIKPGHFNGILARAKTLPVSELVNEVVLRAQAQAMYAIENCGHFGLNLRRYAHFTSPIRRYADLLVHRALIRACRLGDGGLADEETGAHLAETAQAISDAERRAMAAERETADRLIARFLAERVGATFEGRVSGVTRSGLFVRLRDTGADGFVPVATLGQEYFRHDEEHHALVGERSGAGYQLGDTVSVRLVEAIPTAGALRFEVLSDGKPLRRLAKGRLRTPRRPRRPGRR